MCAFYVYVLFRLGIIQASLPVLTFESLVEGWVKTSQAMLAFVMLTVPLG